MEHELTGRAAMASDGLRLLRAAPPGQEVAGDARIDRIR
ncbi:MAG: hypothetical protein JWN88_2785 [Frankiales bacterium]|nr:hypothetical protein [Frankiales bacterium]